ncbi:hypothetical protein BU25DRAFT_435520 [Macroventuria anomochaeta]|uniref:Uncharacterized protein n=1 Tax=Macroventuria anomochaeta TaxID=301207 RepID=A0ACB6RJZ5_9PLEO|nr:uncharacterized protein BU25DRAFT_435520 [Macroventuria anomochaeta]KAF2621479.1 hypothetical protein BU25DRAFT_435520 [Macroventuria anomochaeta]
MHIEPLKNSLEEVRHSLSERLKRHGTAILDHKRTEHLMACLQTCHACTEVYLSSDLINSTTPSGLLFSYCLNTLHKLSTLQDPMWDTALVRQTVDVVSLLERCADAVEKSNTQVREKTGEDSAFLVAAKTLRELAHDWRTNSSQENQVASGSELESWGAVEPIDLSLMEFSSDFWLNVPFHL